MTDPAATDRQLTDQTHAERARLVDLTTRLSPEQWATPSLCDGWRVREVVAHLTMPFRGGLSAFLLGMVRARFDFNRYADRDARATTEGRADQDLVDLWRANIDHPWRPPGGGAAGALSHDVIHGLDITVPLGLPGPPPERIALMVRHAGDRNFDYFGVDLGDARLEADDVELAIGEGRRTVRLPAADLLLVVTGRRRLPEVAATD